MVGLICMLLSYSTRRGLEEFIISWGIFFGSVILFFAGVFILVKIGDSFSREIQNPVEYLSEDQSE